MESPPIGRLVSFTLRDVPLEVRRRAGAALIRDAGNDADLRTAIEVKRAIENPSPTVYRVPESAWHRALECERSAGSSPAG